MGLAKLIIFKISRIFLMSMNDDDPSRLCFYFTDKHIAYSAAKYTIMLNGL